MLGSWAGDWRLETGDCPENGGDCRFLQLTLSRFLSVVQTQAQDQAKVKCMET